MTSTPPEPAQTASQDPILATAGRYYRNTRYLMVLLLLGYGIWSIRDGYFVWPKQNADAIEQARAAAISKGLDPDKVVDPNSVPHPGLDVPFNRVFGLALPPLSLLVLAWALYRSRGEYRLEGQTLTVPGHPPVPFEYITDLDRDLWDRKGIAYVSYDLGDGRRGRLKLDDFIYDRPPTDEIYKRIDEYVNPPKADAPAVEQRPAG